jgi:hypothetical protein
VVSLIIIIIIIIEIQPKCNVKKVIPVITGANGTILKSVTQYLSNILGKA